MYMDQLKVETLSVDDIYLDPNNPRFWTQANRPIVPDKNIESKQARARQDIELHGIQDLYNSIVRNGFLPMDRIVVRPIEGVPGKYVVVEGNRRFRSLTKLRADIKAGEVTVEDVDDEDLERLLEKTQAIEVLVYQGSNGLDMTWMLQGIRHISGIRDWDPAQRAKLVAEQIDGEHKKIGVVGQQFGLTAVATGRLYRTYRALSQMREDDEYSSKARNDYFSLFEEAYRNTFMRGWLGWSETERAYMDSDNLKRFYSWISPDDEHADKRRIHDPRQIREVSYLIENQHTDLLDEFDRHTLLIEEARRRATTEDPKPLDWRKAMESAISLLDGLPQSAMSNDAEEFLEALGKLAAVIEQRRHMVEVAINGAQI